MKDFNSGDMEVDRYSYSDDSADLVDVFMVVSVDVFYSNVSRSHVFIVQGLSMCELESI